MRLALLAQIALCGAVKHWMFRRCDQNPFCDRNREYAHAIESGDDNAVQYHIDKQSLDLQTPANISGIVYKKLKPEEVEASVGANSNGEVALPFTLSMVNDGVVRFVLDEARPDKLPLQNEHLAATLNPHRYSPHDAVVQHEELSTGVEASVSGNELKVVRGKLSVDLEFAPLKLTVYNNGKPQVVLNGKELLNFEQLRRRQPSDPEVLWSDTFDKHLDQRVRGPESVALDTEFVGFNTLYGIPEHADRLALRDTTNKEPYRLFNVDIFEYETNSPMPMYGSIPLLTAHNEDSAAGVFWLNAADTYVDVKYTDSDSSAHWISEAGKLDVYVILKESPFEVLQEYSTLMGGSQLPQQFAAGYHQCRWNYMSEEDVLSVQKRMDENEIPFDVMWLDIEWTDDRRYFRWNEEEFPNPERMMGVLDEAKRKLVVLNDPHIKARDDYDEYNELVKEQLLVRDNTGEKNYLAHCWPGQSAWIDSLHPMLKNTWNRFHELGTKLGGYARNLYLWSDMSEPSVFSGCETTAEKDVLHYGGWQHRDVHNVYGHLVFDSSYDALIHRYNGTQRPFVLTRSFFAGSQRLGPTWTGDNQAKFEYLQAATPMLLTLGASGYPFAGADVGGFFGNPNAELQTRWFQAGLFYPFFRAHAHVESKRREPYLLPEEHLAAVRSAIELRYALLPHFYTKFFHASRSLKPILTPMSFRYPELAKVDDQFMLGEELVAKPVVVEGARSLDVLLPSADIFYDYFTGAQIDNSNGVIKQQVDLHSIPLFIRGGAVVMRRDRKRRSTELMQNDPYTLVIALDKNSQAEGDFYVDDGVSFDYETREAYLHQQFKLQNNVISGTPLHTPQSTEKFAKCRLERVVIYGKAFSGAEVNNQKLDVMHDGELTIVRNPGVLVGDSFQIQLFE